MSIKQIGATPIQEYHTLNCHCGAVEIELHLPDGVVSPRRCDCSFCRRRGAIMGTTSLPAIRIVKGEDVLSLYQFNTQVARHYFCSQCGIYTHHQRRSDPNEYGFNVGCLEGVNPRDLGEVPIMDGVNHPSDRK
ncbi:MAG: aldehyde-activating protein [Pseudohongiella sp.]|nr:aldehyde-activating protein [Pseudohongiella sp.]